MGSSNVGSVGKVTPGMLGNSGIAGNSGNGGSAGAGMGNSAMGSSGSVHREAISES